MIAARTASRAVRRSTRPIASAARSKHTLPDLQYDYGALAPAISGQIMEHHATYVAGLNTAEEQLGEAVKAQDVHKQIALQAALKFNDLNHSLFWRGLAPVKEGGGELPKDSEIAKAIDRDFGSFDNLKQKWTQAALGIQGSGWAWLGLNPSTKRLEISTTANQDPLLSSTVINGIDMWEHAFYLDVQNRKPEYLQNIFKVINWKESDARLKAAM